MDSNVTPHVGAASTDVDSSDGVRPWTDHAHRGPAGPATLEVARLRGELVAAHATVKHLQTGLQSSRRIGAALGIVMAVREIDLDEAFEVLRTASQVTNRKVRDIAEDILVAGSVCPELLGGSGPDRQPTGPASSTRSA